VALEAGRGVRRNDVEISTASGAVNWGGGVIDAIGLLPVWACGGGQGIHRRSTWRGYRAADARDRAGTQRIEGVIAALAGSDRKAR